MEFIIVTGLSGAGKTQAINCMEDIGYYCIDNMPPALIQNFIHLTVQGKMKISKAAFVMDIRGGEFFDDLISGLEFLDKADMSYKILFLEASDEVLIRRYKETRRTHPLSHWGAISEGITVERERLSEIRKKADYIIDTSNMKAAQLSEEIRNLLFSSNATGFTITIQSFGYKKGIPLDADMVFDMRFIPNPFYLASLKKLTGNNKKVQQYVMRFPESQSFVKQIHGLINELIPSYIREGKSQLVLAFGCTGGQHRSVTMANVFKKLLKDDGWRVLTIHRDL
ncbi:MAG: RNase adapter RapZ [Eubacteriales bacterium]|nr:RNase adapter RapZ [Eubacteriales bacterium]MDD4583447.1 RNase adapter RapZ [Eubacteriales bacterium]